MESRWQRFNEKMFSHIETWRPYTVIWCGLLSLSGACLIFHGLPPTVHVFLVIAIPILGWIAGLYLSDYLDVHLDMIQKAHRPIPSGRMHRNEALIIGGAFAIIGITLTLLLGVQNLVLSICAAFLVYCYARFTKSHGILGNLNRGALAVISFLFGVFSFGGPLETIPLVIWLLCIVFLLHDMNTNLVGTFRDVESDKKGGYYTIPVTYGIRKAVCLAFMLSIIWFLLAFSLAAVFFNAPPIFYVLSTIEVLLLVIISYLLSQLVKDYSRKKALMIHKYFIIERITLASAFIIIVIPIQIGIIVYLISLILSALFQMALRNQYEFSKWEL